MVQLLEAVLVDLGDTLVHMSRPWDEVFHDNLEALHSYLAKLGLKVNFNRFAETFIQVFDAASATADTYNIEIPMEEIIGEALQKSGFEVLGVDLNRNAMVEFYGPEIDAWEPYPDTVETLTALRKNGFRMGLISNAKSDWAVHAILEKNRINDFFDDIITSALMRIRKPRPEIFARTLKDLNVKASDAVFVGDSLDADVGGARMAGMRSIHLSRKPLDSTPVARPEATATSLTEALKQINAWQNGFLKNRQQPQNLEQH